MPNTPSPSFSFQGWEFIEWLKGNWKDLKPIIKIVAPAALVWWQTADPAMTGGLALIGKGLLDVVEYWIKQR